MPTLTDTTLTIRCPYCGSRDLFQRMLKDEERHAPFRRGYLGKANPSCKNHSRLRN